MIDQTILRHITARIIAVAAPRKIFVFGSQSNGTATAHSDLDLMILVDDDVSSTIEIAARLYQETAALADLPVDILVEREGVFYARGALPTMERLILREGVVVYAA